MKDPLESLTFALQKYPERVQVAAVDPLVIDSARGNDKRPAYLKIAVSDEVVKGLRGSPERRRELLVLVSIPIEVLERSKSRIILPGEV